MNHLARILALVLVLGPCALAQAAPFAYITNRDSDSVSVIDVATDTVVATIAVGDGPLGVAVDRTGSRVYVANQIAGTVSIINAATNTVAATVPVGGTLTAIEVNPAGTRAYVSDITANRVAVIDTASAAVIASVAVGEGPWGIAVTPDGSRVYVANRFNPPAVTIIDGTTNQAIGVITGFTGAAQALALGASGERLYVLTLGGELSIVDTATASIVRRAQVGNPLAVMLALSPDGSRIYVTTFAAATSSPTSVAVVDATTLAVLARGGGAGVTPGGVDVEPAGAKVYVIQSAAGAVAVVDAATQAVLRYIPVGVNPQSFGNFIIGPSAAYRTPTLGHLGLLLLGIAVATAGMAGLRRRGATPA